MKYYSHLQTAVQLIELYRGNQPFGDYAKEFFRANKKYGSTDRRQILQLCYAVFRTGRAFSGLPLNERILIGLFLSSQEPNVLLENLQPEWNEKVTSSMEEKLAICSGELTMIFPWKDELSAGIDHEEYCQSFFVQPDLFLRIRPGYEGMVKNKLEQAGISFRTINENCLALPNASKADQVIETNKEAVVQDLNSQRVAELIKKAGGYHEINNIWDCCAGSGGKSIMAFDAMNHIKLTVSDIRATMLHNLEQRFNSAGIKSYNAFAADIAANDFDPQKYFSSKTKFDLILADVPCTGSGTWSRTPEHLSYFRTKQIEEYALVQKSIVDNVIPQLLPGGAFLYITCSVFKKENEEQVKHIQQKHGLKLQQVELLKGYDQKADTLFAALFTS